MAGRSKKTKEFVEGGCLSNKSDLPVLQLTVSPVITEDRTPPTPPIITPPTQPARETARNRNPDDPQEESASRDQQGNGSWRHKLLAIWFIAKKTTQILNVDIY